MPLPAALTKAATRIAQSETAREIAKNVVTAGAEKLTQKALQRMDDSRPAARTSHSAGDTRVPRRHTLPQAAAAAEGEVKTPAFALNVVSPQQAEAVPPTYEQSQAAHHLGKLAPPQGTETLPPSYEQAMEKKPTSPALNPDALPFMRQDGSWVEANDPSHPAHKQAAAARPAPQRPVPATPETPPPTYAQATARPAAAPPTASKRSSFRQALRDFFGGGAKVAETKNRPQKNVVTTVRGQYEGQPIEIKLSRKDTRAFQEQHGIADRDFDVLQYLAFEKRRDDELRPANVKIDLGGFGTRLARLDLNEIEFNQYDANQRATFG
ncbi:MAG: hypothetical protein ABW067_08470 [Rhizobacter sp.]